MSHDEYPWNRVMVQKRIIEVLSHVLLNRSNVAENAFKVMHVYANS